MNNVITPNKSTSPSSKVVVNTAANSLDDKYGGLTPRYYWFFISLMVVLSMFGSFVNDMYTPALPEMARAFGCSASTAQLGLSAGMLGLGLGQVFFGPYSDKHGRKRVLYIGMGVFLVGGVASIFSPSIYFFLGCRVVQGAGASTAYFLARTIPADITGGRALARMMAVIGAINGISPASAPILGGIFTQYMGWRSVFVFLSAFAVLLILVSLKLKESLPVARRAKGSLWQTFEGYRVLLANRRFMTHVCLKGFGLALLFAYISACPFIIHQHYGYSTMDVGLFIGLNAVFVIIGSMAALKFKRLRNAGVAGAWGVLPIVAVMAWALWSVHSFVLYEVLNCLMLLCTGLIFTMANSLSMDEGRADAGRASAILGFVGYALGAVAAPLVGVGDILHSTAIVLAVCGVGTWVFGLLSARIAPELT